MKDFKFTMYKRDNVHAKEVIVGEKIITAKNYDYANIDFVQTEKPKHDYTLVEII